METAKEEAADDDSFVLSLMERLSNWGRWGVDDELGTLNFITATVRLAAMESSVKAREKQAPLLLYFVVKFNQLPRVESL